MPAKVAPDAVDDLAEELVRLLESRAGDDGPVTLRTLGDLCREVPDDALLLRAAVKKSFSAKVDVQGKVDRKAVIGSFVSLKKDKPRKESKPRPIRHDPIPELAARMLQVLGSLRSLEDDDAYPPTLRRLAELCEVNASDAKVPKAVGHRSFTPHAVVAAKAGAKPSLDAPVVTKADADDLAPATVAALVRYAIVPAPGKATKTRSDAFAINDLKARLITPLRPGFARALERGIERESLPTEVAWVHIKGKPHLFLLNSLHPRPAATTTPKPAPPPPPPAVDFATAFREAFDRLDDGNGSTNFVKLLDLRRALPGFDRAGFDAGLRQLRVAGEFSLDSSEGMRGQLTQEDRDAGINESGSLLIFASRR